MKTWAIVDIKSLEIVNTYVSLTARQDSFGGPWGDNSKTMHLLIPAELAGSQIKCELLESVQAQDEDGEPMEHLVPGPTQIAHDSQGRVILGEDGKPLLVSSFEYVPEMVSAFRIVQK